MFVFTDKRGKVVGGFVHWSDAQEFDNSNKRHHYGMTDVPDMDLKFQEWLGTAIDGVIRAVEAHRQEK